VLKFIVFRCEFPEILDLNEFVENPEDDFTYVLQSVLVHSGSTDRGHYVVYINTSEKLSESNVSRCLESLIIL
jgi:ubiquitin C-terminal hydrolase